MTRMIDADALNEKFQNLSYDDWNQGVGTTWANAFLEAETIVDDAPTIDAVPVVRCAECKWFQCNMSAEGYLPKGVDEFECRHWCGSCDPVDFCSYGEREENG